MRSSRKLRPKGTGGQKAFCGWRKCFRKLVVPSENESYTALGALHAPALTLSDSYALTPVVLRASSWWGTHYHRYTENDAALSVLFQGVYFIKNHHFWKKQILHAISSGQLRMHQSTRSQRACVLSWLFHERAISKVTRSRTTTGTRGGFRLRRVELSQCADAWAGAQT